MEIWSETAEPCLKGYLKKHSKVTLKSNPKDLVKNRYDQIRDQIHPQMANPVSLIDRHKIAAAFVQSVLDVIPINTPQILDSKQDTSIIGEAYFLNEKFAFHLGTSVLYSYMMDDFKQQNDQNSISAIKNGLYFPETKHDGNYQDNVTKLLYASRMKKVFDLFSFAHIFFFIESYTLLKFKSLQKGLERIS